MEKEVHQFGYPVPFSLVHAELVYDPEDVLKRRYWERVSIWNLNYQIEDAFSKIKNVYGTGLLYFGVSGSASSTKVNGNSDIDIFCVVDRLIDARILTQTDMMVSTREELKNFLELGEPIVTNLFVKSNPLYYKDDVNKMKEIKPIVGKSIPYLITRSKFEYQNAFIFREMGRKFNGILNYLSKGTVNNQDFKKEIFDTGEKRYLEIRNFYYKEALKALFYSCTHMLEALHVKRRGTVADLDPLIKFSLTLKTTFLKELYKKRKAASYRLETVTDQDFEKFLKLTREFNEKIEREVNKY